RVAYLSGLRTDQRLESLLRIHVPRRHGLQPGVAEPYDLPAGRRPLRYRGLSPRSADLDPRARDLRDDGAIPLAEDCGALVRIPYPRPGLRKSWRFAHVHGAAL